MMVEFGRNWTSAIQMDRMGSSLVDRMKLFQCFGRGSEEAEEGDQNTATASPNRQSGYVT
jgi:hypothetical protein